MSIWPVCAIAIFLGLGPTSYRQSQSGEAQMSYDYPVMEVHPFYTIEVRLRSGEQTVRRVVGRFDDSVYSKFWEELGVGQEQWSEWQNALSSGQPFTLVPTAPQVSRIASADEGAVTFVGSTLQQLHDECVTAMLRVGSLETRSLLSDLVSAANVASVEHGEVVVHPFGE